MILLAVALFAALAYTVTGSTRSSGGDAQKEQNVLLASEITQYSTELETAIMRMKISNSCTNEQISFENPISTAASRNFNNPNSPADYRCHVFRPEGGNVAFREFPTANVPSTQIPAPYQGYQNVYFVAQGIMYNIGASNVDSADNAELRFFLMGIRKELCQEINKKLGIIDPDSNVTVDSLNFGIPFQGLYYGSGEGILGDGSGSLFAGQRSGCYRETTAGTPHVYQYYHVLIAR